MPEGAEVSRLTAELNKKLSGHIIKDVNILSGKYSRTAPFELDTLLNAKIERVTCKGKLIVFQLVQENKQFALLSMLGMTGWWQSLRARDEPLYRHARFELNLASGSKSIFFDQRNFGTLKIVSIPELHIKLDQLGPDILSPPRLWKLAIPEFISRVRRYGRSSALAEGLLDQRIAAGCGNYIRADSMHLVRLSPLLALSELDDTDLTRIWEAMSCIATAALKDVHPLDGSKKFTNLCYKQECSSSGNLIETYKDKNGRTVHWCPKEQLRGEQ